jgi:hypothetical protein
VNEKKKAAGVFGLLLAGAIALTQTLGPGRPTPARAQGADIGIIPMAAVWNGVAPNISGGIFAKAGLSPKPKRDGSALRISFTPAVSTVLYLTESNGTTTLTYALNGGTAVSAGQAFTAVWGMRKTDKNDGTGNALTYDLVEGQVGTIPVARLDEITGGVD